MKIAIALMMMGIATSAAAAGVDYTVGVANLGSEPGGGGSALNAYSISDAGVKLLPGSPYVLNLKDPNGNTTYPYAVTLNTAHNFAYVEYVNIDLPYIVGFSITPNGLVYQWNIVASDAGNNFVNSIVAGPNYVIAYSNPAGLWAQIINQEGQQVTSEGSSLDGVQLTAISVAGDGLFYYACHDAEPGQPPTAVKVWKLPPGTFTGTAPQPITPKLLLKSTDPTFIQAQCH